MLILAPQTSKFSPAAHVTARKRPVFVFCFAGPEAPDPGKGGPLTERSKTLGPARVFCVYRCAYSVPVSCAPVESFVGTVVRACVLLRVLRCVSYIMQYTDTSEDRRVVPVCCIPVHVLACVSYCVYPELIHTIHEAPGRIRDTSGFTDLRIQKMLIHTCILKP